jgi:Flp pilus assembly protein TadD
VCESGVKLQPDDAEMHAGMGWALVQLGRHGDANRAFAEGLRLAVSTNARDEIVRMMRREMNALTQIEEPGHC